MPSVAGSDDTDGRRHRQHADGLHPVPADRVRALRARLAGTAAAIVSTEEAVARVREDLAAKYPARATRYLREAAMAREQAERARRFARSLGH